MGPARIPYLIGRSEGYGVLDIVRAALWAGSLAHGYTSELKLRGVAAFAPASHIATKANLLTTVTTTALTPLAATILRGIDIKYPSLHIVSLLTPTAARLYPQTLTTCLGGLAVALRTYPGARPTRRCCRQRRPTALADR